MRRIVLAIRTFFRVLFDAAVAEEIRRILSQTATVGQEALPPRTGPPPALRPPARSEALTLLAALQREARFVDFIKEPLDRYTDAQIGAAARDVHRDCGTVLERLFALEPVVSDEEGAEVEVPAGFDAGRYHLTGNVTGEPPFHGQLMHHGWEATTCRLPAWSGTDAAARLVAPAEVGLK